jgi:integrase
MTRNKEGTTQAETKCPNCSFPKTWKAGHRTLSDGSETQRWICLKCNHRFSKHFREIKAKKLRARASNKKAKNLNPAQVIEKTCAGDGNLLNYAWLLKKKRGAADNTINLRISTLRLIQKKGVNLNDHESFETLLATEPLTKARKWQFVSCYKSYTKIMKIPWEAIHVKYEPKEPFMPTHEEMNALISAASKRLAAFLQTALTTGGRVGELCKLKWIDVNTEPSKSHRKR